MQKHIGMVLIFHSYTALFLINYEANFRFIYGEWIILWAELATEKLNINNITYVYDIADNLLLISQKKKSWVCNII